MTLTTTVMVMETTGALQLIVPLMITVFVAKVLSRCALSVSSHTLSIGHIVWVRMCLRWAAVMLPPSCRQPRQTTQQACP